MHTFWNAALAQAGISPQSPAPLTAPADGWMTPLNSHRVLHLHGPDTEKFLQGQVTCDLNQLTADHSLMGANCTPKGNVISAFRLLQLAPHNLLLRVNDAIADAALANLRKYIVFSKAELDDGADSWGGIGLGGQTAAAVIAQALGGCPAEVEQQYAFEQGVVVRVPGELPRYEIWASRERIQPLWDQLGSALARVAPNFWRAQEARAGLIELDADSVDSYLPHMLNLQAVAGISFTKGCYTGQEVVARLQYRGKLKKLLYAATVTAKDATPGQLLHSDTRSSAGKVLAVIPQEDGSQLLQAVINKGEADAGALRLEAADGPAVTLLPHPYSIDPALFERG
ncbi:YgfZ/GcvT domain-containing protein [Motiliproteus sediminis]|uniref:CAF17-like 4Fe-4S cluster assembly/insertion protein YgfZ n=1 Tax=Motiliproteus sediminis TaxID=1468178 RepID=UPI001AEF3CCC|nr:folate-binding protein YgfZ [Motiliproteus sediminis]